MAVRRAERDIPGVAPHNIDDRDAPRLSAVVRCARRPSRHENAGLTWREVVDDVIEIEAGGRRRREYRYCNCRGY